MKILFVFADPREAEPTLTKLQATPCGDSLWRAGKHHIAVSGWGSTRAAASVTRYKHLANQIWNFGLAGALNPHLSIGTIGQIASVEGISLQAEGWRLVSADQGVHGGALYEELAPHYDVVDMEGRGIVTAAGNTPCHLWKIISDHAGPNAKREIAARLPQLAQQLAIFTAQQLESFA